MRNYLQNVVGEMPGISSAKAGTVFAYFGSYNQTSCKDENRFSTVARYATGDAVIKGIGRVRFSRDRSGRSGVI